MQRNDRTAPAGNVLAEQKGNPRMQILQPPNWPRPNGFSNGIAARGRLVFIAGQIGWDEQCRITSSDFSEQVRQVLRNIIAVLAASEGKREHIVRLTWYVTDKREYLAA